MECGANVNNNSAKPTYILKFLATVLKVCDYKSGPIDHKFISDGWSILTERDG